MIHPDGIDIFTASEHKLLDAMEARLDAELKSGRGVAVFEVVSSVDERVWWEIERRYAAAGWVTSVQTAVMAGLGVAIRQGSVLLVHHPALSGSPETEDLSRASSFADSA